MIYLSGICIIIGFLFITSGILGMLRFPDFFSKVHAAGVIECCGIPITLAGLALAQDNYIASFKLVLMTIAIFIMNPVATHILSRSSLKDKIDKNGRIR